MGLLASVDEEPGAANTGPGVAHGPEAAEVLATPDVPTRLSSVWGRAGAGRESTFASDSALETTCE